MNSAQYRLMQYACYALCIFSCDRNKQTVREKLTNASDD